MQKVVRKMEFVKKGEGIISGVAYDTAWTARVTDGSGKPLFPQCVNWLLHYQRPDGSWGSQIQNYHDRLISTLSAVIALKEIDERRYSNYIKRGETYIWKNLKNVKLDTCKLVGSELLLPSLMEQAELMELNLPYHIKVYEREYHAKLSKIEESLWYSPLTTLSFSLEFLGDKVDLKRLLNVQLPNGSVATSPAATAFFLKHTKDAKAFMYLKEVLSLTRDGSVIATYPMEIFEYSWIMYNLMLAGLYFERYTEICDFLVSHLGRSGVGCSVDMPLTDADDTAVVCKILHDMQYPVDIKVLNAFDKGDHYTTYNFEIDPSVSTNIHVLDFVYNCPEFPDRERAMERLVRFLREKMYPRGFWLDKWHISPYYPTSHAIFALCDIETSLVEKAVSWILESQNENGMWGENGGTLEETAYAVQALVYYHRHVEYIDTECVLKALSAMSCINPAPLSANLAGLWVGKTLYTPAQVVWSSIASGQFMVRAGNFNRSVPAVCWW